MDASMGADVAGDFASYLLSKNHIAAAGGARQELADLELAEARDGHGSLRRLWEQTELPATEFADEVARFYHLPRAALPRLLSGSALVKQFSRRFLREMMVFPYQSAEGQLSLAVADPSDSACVRAAEIVLGGSVGVEVASFEDITTVLNERLGDDDAATPDAGDAPFAQAQGHARADDDIDSLRDLASGAPV